MWKAEFLMFFLMPYVIAVALMIPISAGQLLWFAMKTGYAWVRAMIARRREAA